VKIRAMTGTRSLSQKLSEKCKNTAIAKSPLDYPLKPLNRLRTKDRLLLEGEKLITEYT
jgi:hypothetical protein